MPLRSLKVLLICSSYARYKIMVLLLFAFFNGMAQTHTHMQRLHFKTNIEASPQSVYQVIIDSLHFREWTSVFSPTSRFEGTWQAGSKMRFLSEDENGSTMGLISIVKENKPGAFISLEHIGWIADGHEITDGPDVEKMKGALENYTLIPHEWGTSLEVDSDALPEFGAYFQDTWPRALERIKAISERK